MAIAVTRHSPDYYICIALGKMITVALEKTAQAAYNDASRHVYRGNAFHLQVDHDLQPNVCHTRTDDTSKESV